MAEASNNLPTKNRVETAFHLGDNNRDQIKKTSNV